MSFQDSQQVLYVLDLKGPKGDGQSAQSHGRIAVGTASGDGNLKTLIDHEHLPDGIDIVQDGKGDGRMYWTQMGTPDQNDGQIQSAALDGSDIQQVFEQGTIQTPKQIIVDRLNRKIYVCDREGLRVHRSNMDGTDKEILIKRGDWRNPEERENKNIQCVGIAVDAKHGKFYWTQKGPSKGGSGQIYRANIVTPEGKNADTRDDIEELFRDLPEPIDLKIDSETQTLYWSDRGAEPRGNTLNKADVSGISNPGSEQKYDIIAKSLHEAIGIKIDHKSKHIYASDLGGSVYIYGLNGGKPIVEQFKGQGAYTGIALIDLPSAKAKQLCGIA